MTKTPEQLALTMDYVADVVGEAIDMVRDRLLAVADITRIDEVGPLEDPVIVMVLFGIMRRVSQSAEAEASFTQSFREALKFERSYEALRAGLGTVQ